jgi:hypothetical protein
MADNYQRPGKGSWLTIIRDSQRFLVENYKEQAKVPG